METRGLMAKLHFYYSAMNAGKTTTLLQSSYNYRERGLKTLLFKPLIDDRDGKGHISSRIGLKSEAIEFDATYNFYEELKTYCTKEEKPACLLIDEAQFLNKAQVLQLTKIADLLGIPVLCYGLRTDFMGEPFEGSRYLLALAEELSEIKTICHCGRKATMNIRMDENGKPVRVGEQVEIGGNDRYIATCRRHFYDDKLRFLPLELGEEYLVA
jgi:thymidine kinase